MQELMRSNDVVLVNFVEVLLRDAGCRIAIADQNMSVMEGSIGAFPRRILVAHDDLRQAVRVLREADLEQWLSADALRAAGQSQT